MRAWLAVVVGVLLAVCTLALAPPDNNFQFAIMGDRTGRPNDEVYQQVWRDVQRANPAFVINVGDSIVGGSDMRAEAEWDGLVRLWKQVAYPMYCTPGNHDIWSPFSRALYEKKTGHAPAYSFDYQNAHFIILDNSRTEELAPDQMKFLEEDLKNNALRSPKFIFFHKPFWLLLVKFRNGEFPLHRLAKKYDVGYVISGHLHRFVAVNYDGVAYVSAGSSGGGIDHGTDAGQGISQGWFFGHMSASVRGGKVTFSVNEAGAPWGEGRKIPAPDWEKTFH